MSIQPSRIIAPDVHAFLGKERPDLDKLLAKWTAILKLRDWECRVFYCRQWDLKPGTEGANTIGFTNKTSCIRILDPVDFCCISWPQDVERTLVHELVHLHLEFFDRAAQGPVNDFREQAVESLTRALIELDRRSA